jgi:hypothetical protein
MKKEIEKRITEIDRIVKEQTGVDLSKLDRQLEVTRKVFRGLDLNTYVYGNEIFLIKARMSGLVH